jgi:hypothetical protein
MTCAAAACLALLTLAACEKRNDNDRNPETGSTHSADTIVTERKMQDTAVVNYDTTVSTDTVHKKGQKPVDTDTVHN